MPTVLITAQPEPAPGGHPGAQRAPRMRGWIHVGATGVFVVAGPVLAAQARTPWTHVALAVYAVDTVLMKRPRTWNYRRLSLSDPSLDGGSMIARRKSCELCKDGII